MTWADFVALSERAAQDGTADEVTSRIEAIGSDDPATLLYTSGTTGNPKGVVITHGAVLYEVHDRRDGRQYSDARPVGVLPAAGPHRRADVQPLPGLLQRRAQLLLSQHHRPGEDGRRGEADGVLRRAEGLGEDPGRHPVAAHHGAGRVAGRPPSPPRWTSAAGTWRRCQYGQSPSDRAGRPVRRGRRQRARPDQEPARARRGDGRGQRRRPAAARGRRLLRRTRHEDARRLRDDRDHRRLHHQHARRVQARHGRPRGPRHRGQDRRRWRDPGPRPAQHSRLPEPARPDRASCWTRTAGCTPATSARSTTTASSR